MDPWPSARRGMSRAGSPGPPARFTLCYAHSDEDVASTLTACEEALAILAEAVEERRVEARLEGPAILPVFRIA